MARRIKAFGILLESARNGFTKHLTHLTKISTLSLFPKILNKDQLQSFKQMHQVIFGEQANILT